jgi:ATP phosphoribosyltransferase regulatory subunit
MNNNLLHTPEGVRDIYGAEYARKQWVEQAISQQFTSYGYEEIQTTMFEFFEVFAQDIGTTPTKDLFKFFDNEGNTLVLRPDFTPSVARCAAKYFGRTKDPLRFCYQGNTYSNTSSLQGKLKEMTEMGAELIGARGVSADGEIIALVIESLLATGLKEFQVSIGHAQYFNGMCEQAGLNEETKLALRDHINAKNIIGAEQLLLQAGVERKNLNKLLQMTDLFGTYDILRRAEEQADNETSKEAIKRLNDLYLTLCYYRVEKYVSFDLGMLGKYGYYTGIHFKCYAYGVGDVVAKGGRYDELLEKFGKPAPAIGFGIAIDPLMVALERQKAEIPHKELTIITYRHDDFRDALVEARIMRKDGHNVCLNRARKRMDEQPSEEYETTILPQLDEWDDSDE